ncbi:metal ABC transporter substrate-binding protein [Halobacterium yunchengense]|uniref:metal ABC transporter substrate-binding protein n=1 Tax=Halobacterium yunchengense TaxID=3108497 RepID=UPI00300BDDA3
MEMTRRQLVATAATAAVGGTFAGCLGDTGGGGDDAGTTAQASFFVFGTLAERVAGDAAEAKLLVPTGQHGHGWEPGPSVREDVQTADLLVHGPPDFQPWVDDVRGELDADGADVHAVDVTADVDLLEAGSSHDRGDEHDDSHDEEHGDQHSDEEHDEHDEHGDEHGDEHDEHGDEHGDEHSDGHAHGAHDPHFWMDPLRLRDAVDAVRAGFVAVDDGNADAYGENADAFREDLAALHDDLRATVEDADRDVLLVAGHDSFQYLGARYGVQVEALTGIAPDDQPTTRDLAHAQSVVDEHGLEYVCADPLESQRAAEKLLEETDLEAVLPLTAMPGVTDEWRDGGWGYLDVMERVNLPTLERALEAQ